MGLLDDPDLGLNLGLGLLQAGGRNLAGQGNIGTALQGALSNYYGQKQAKQSLAIGDIDLQQKQLQNQKTMQLLNMVGGLMGDPAPGGSDGAGSPSAAPGAPAGLMGASGGPMMAQNSATPLPTGSPAQQPPSWLTPPTPQMLAQQPVGGMAPRQLQGYNLLSGKDPLQSSKELEAAQLEQAQRQYAPALAKLSTVVKSDSPTREVAADPELSAAWNQLAKLHGFDPKADLNDQNLRTAFTFAHNGLASSIGKETIAPTVPKKQVNGPLGSQYEIDPITNETKQVKGEEALKDVMVNGQPTNLRASAAEGREPYVPSIFGAGQMTDPAMELAYQQYKLHGTIPTGFARNPVMNAKLTDYIAQRSKEEGVSAADAAASGQQLKASGAVVQDFEKGKTAQTINGLNTAIKHGAALDPLIDALGSGNITAINAAKQFFQKQTGQTAPGNFAALKEFYGGEVAKAVLPGGGGEAERRALLAPLANANSPQQLKQALQTFNTALAGKTDALRQQWDVGTGGKQGSFDKFLLPETKKALGISGGGNAAHPQDIQNLLSKYGNGNGNGNGN